MRNQEITADDRREFMKRVAQQFLGVSFASGLGSLATSAVGAVPATATTGKAKHIIYLFMNGAMSHLDTFDPKTGVDEAGETKPIQSSVAGIQYGDRFPKLAALAGAIAVIRSLSTETGDHEGGTYLMRTAYKKINSIQHPALGGWMVSEQGRINKELPGNFLIGSDNRHPGCGFLEPSLSPVPIPSAAAGLQNVELPKYLDETLFNRRLTLASQFDKGFQSRRQSRHVEAYNQLYSEARRLLGSEHLKVFNIKDEPDNIREAYGTNTLGQACLLARRLVQSGVRFVEVNYGGWDMHQDIYNRLDDNATNVDNAVSSLLRDLNSKGLLSETLVVLTTEFGRSPEINANVGRDHHPGAFSSLLAGAGIRGGQVYGASDKRGFSVDRDHVSVSDFNKTIAAAAGLPIDKEIHAPNGRPFKIGGNGDPVKALLA